MIRPIVVLLGVPLFCRDFGCFGAQIHRLSFSILKMAVSTLPKHYVLKGKRRILTHDGNNALRLGERRQKDKWFHFHACTGGRLDEPT